jgi:hypothetical protein
MNKILNYLSIFTKISLFHSVIFFIILNMEYILKVSFINQLSIIISVSFIILLYLFFIYKIWHKWKIESIFSVLIFLIFLSHFILPNYYNTIRIFYFLNLFYAISILDFNEKPWINILLGLFTISIFVLLGGFEFNIFDIFDESIYHDLLYTPYGSLLKLYF